MLPYPHFPRRLVHDLSGIWDFAFLGAVDLDALDPASQSTVPRSTSPWTSTS